MISSIDGASETLTFRLGRWFRRVGLGRKAAISLVLCSILAGVATYVALTGTAPFGPSPDVIRFLLMTDLVLLLLLSAIVAHHLVRLWVERRRGSAGSRLHIRMVGLFSLVAVAPAILVAIFSILFFNLGIQGWFSERVNAAVRNSVAVAEAYLREHRQNIRADVLAMANDLNRAAPLYMSNPERFKEIVNIQATVRSLDEAMVFDSSGRILAKSNLTFLMQLSEIPKEALAQATGGEVVLLNPSSEDRVRAMVRLDRFFDAYLAVGRMVEPAVIDHLERTRRAVAGYQQLEAKRYDIEITFVLIFIVVALLVLLAAVWFGLSIATAVVRPVGELVGAAERVRQGDLTARVEEGRSDDEMGTLSRAFNRMTAQLSDQRNELIEANRQLDDRRRFTEAVLAGVSAGVIGLDRNGRVDLPNRSAVLLLQRDYDAMVGQPLEEVVPEMADLLSQARERPEKLIQGEVIITRDGQPRNLLVRVAAERVGTESEGYVVTFDDITQLVTAQRTAAWADVARRIAHEIKNPLTPIQLSAERLRRKYLGQILSDREIFTQCTDTIVRQVSDIGRMVDEFSFFARMPDPAFKTENVIDIVKQIVFEQKLVNPDIDYVTDFGDGEVLLRCDSGQISQVMMNLLKNAAESIERRNEPIADKGSHKGADKGSIRIQVEEAGDVVSISVTDNGLGLPVEFRAQLTEPYVTTRAKGTGLGLAIVKKIVEEHGGKLELADAEGGGATVRVVFPKDDVENPSAVRDEPVVQDETVAVGVKSRVIS